MNTKMKVLSLALIGAFGYVGSAAAGTCPAGPTVPEGGAWSSKTTLSGGVLAITTPGLDASSCKLNSSLANSFASLAIVQDDTPTAEPRYRFQLLVDASATGNFSFTDAVQIFNASAANAFPATGGRREVVAVSLTPGAGGAKQLTVVVSCNNAATQYRCPLTTGDLLPGVNRFEGDLVVGAAGTGNFRYWLNAAAGTTEPAPTGSIAVDNQGWVGPDSAVLGLSSPSPTYKTTHAGQVVSFDTFDSRRSTYIGS